MLGEPEYARADAAEGDRFDSLFTREIEAAAIACGQLRAMLCGRGSVRDRPYGVDDVLRRKVVGVGHLRVPRRFFVPLRIHDVGACASQLYAREGMDSVVDAVMARLPATEHLAVGGVHDGIDRKRGDVALPEPHAGIGEAGLGVIKGGDAFLGQHAFEQLVLHGEPFRAGGNRRPRVDERAEFIPKHLGCAPLRDALRDGGPLEASFGIESEDQFFQKLDLAFRFHVSPPGACSVSRASSSIASISASIVIERSRISPGAHASP